MFVIALLGLVDAGFSGDWQARGLLSDAAAATARTACFTAGAAHVVLTAAAGFIAQAKGEGLASAAITLAVRERERDKRRARTELFSIVAGLGGCDGGVGHRRSSLCCVVFCVIKYGWNLYFPRLPSLIPAQAFVSCIHRFVFRPNTASYTFRHTVRLRHDTYILPTNSFDECRRRTPHALSRAWW